MMTLAVVAMVLALLPLGMTIANLRVFKTPHDNAPDGTRISILIPARNEAATISATIRAALASTGCEIEIVVLDDQSTDETANIVGVAIESDARVRLERAPPLPSGWAGKQRACWMLAQHARHEILMFIDADVRLSSDAVSMAAGFLLRDPRLGLASGFPREVTESWSERWVNPWIHVLLLGYLPISRMRRSMSTAFGAGCGQWMITRRDAYFACGGHSATSTSLHDGISLPRTFRAHAWRTDVFDATKLATCRMYENFPQLWRGFAKSAGEGMATPVGLPVWTVLIAGGHVLPWMMLPVALLDADAALALITAIGVGANLFMRALLARRLDQYLGGIWSHSLGAVLLLAIQWSALIGYLRGKPNLWRGRAYVRA